MVQVPARADLSDDAVNGDHLVEGASDAAALYAVGVLAVGRSTAFGSGAEHLWLTRLLRGHPDRDITVVGDRDPSRVGLVGAQKLAEHLRQVLDRPVGLALPVKGSKDVREQVVAGKWHKGLVIQKGN